MLKSKNNFNVSLGKITFKFIAIIIGVGIGIFIGFYIGSKGLTKEDSEMVHNITLAFAALLGIPFLVWRTYLEDQRTLHSKEDLIARKISEATKNLSATDRVPRYEKLNNGNWQTWEKEVVDIGARNAGLLALEGIAIEHQEKKLPIVEIISEYISRRSREARCLSKEVSDASYFLSSDIDTAIRILSELAHSENSYIDKRSQAPQIVNAQLPNSNLMRKSFVYFDFSNTNFSFSNFTQAQLVSCWLENVKFNHVIMAEVNLYGSSLRGADLQGAEFLTADMLKFTYGVKKGRGRTTLPSYITEDQVSHWYVADDTKSVSDTESKNAFMKGYIAWLRRVTSDYPVEENISLNKSSLTWIKNIYSQISESK